MYDDTFGEMRNPSDASSDGRLVSDNRSRKAAQSSVLSVKLKLPAALDVLLYFNCESYMCL